MIRCNMTKKCGDSARALTPDRLFLGNIAPHYYIIVTKELVDRSMLSMLIICTVRGSQEILMCSTATTG